MHLATAISDIEYDLRSANRLHNNDRNQHTRSPRGQAATTQPPPAVTHAHQAVHRFHHLTHHLLPQAEQNYIQTIQHERHLSARLDALRVRRNILLKQPLGQHKPPNRTNDTDIDDAHNNNSNNSNNNNNRHEHMKEKLLAMLDNDTVALKRWHNAKLEYEHVQQVRQRKNTTTTTPPSSLLQPWWPFFQRIGRHPLDQTTVPRNQGKRCSDVDVDVDVDVGVLEPPPPGVPCFQCSYNANQGTLQFKTRQQYTSVTVVLTETRLSGTATVTMQVHPVMALKPTAPTDVTDFFAATPEPSLPGVFIRNHVWLWMNTDAANEKVIEKYKQEQRDRRRQNLVAELLQGLVDAVCESVASKYEGEEGLRVVNDE